VANRAGAAGFGFVGGPKPEKNKNKLDPPQTNLWLSGGPEGWGGGGVFRVSRGLGGRFPPGFCPVQFHGGGRGPEAILGRGGGGGGPKGGFNPFFWGQGGR